MTSVAILGYGQIGQALSSILSGPIFFAHIDYIYVVDNVDHTIPKCNFQKLDIQKISESELSSWLKAKSISYVINSLPFFLNEKVAQAAREADCSYIDFTEDDQMSDKVREIYKDSNLNCAVKCGLAPGYINYIGKSLAEGFDNCSELMVSVGALPRLASYDSAHPEFSYNLSWSVDGLVNEYIRPCRVRKNGKIREIDALGGQKTVIIDGFEYEAAYTSGGIGSLVEDLENVKNVHYMTLRYPGHYKYIRNVVQENNNNFEKIKKVFQEKFPYTTDDVIVAYAEAIGTDQSKRLVKKTYADKFYGINGLTGIQATTAGSGAAILELFLKKQLGGLVNHKDILLDDFQGTMSYRIYYSRQK
jgi:saccharopine dehydrogenase-like NADP-dependent oxidoreductase